MNVNSSLGRQIVLLDWILSILWGLATIVVMMSRRRFRHSTLSVAWAWAIPAVIAWWGAWIGTLMQPDAPGVDQAWYLAAVLSLCPMIAVLGAKRPGARVWSAFILLPLVIVLEWPAVALWFAGRTLPPLELSTPVIVGYALVLFMGAGNFVATRYSFGAVATALALCGIVGSLGEPGSPLAPYPAASQRTALLLLSLGILSAGRQARRPTVAADPCDRVWFDYRDSFGIVWGRRFLERVNDRARVENWPCRLTESGFVWFPEVTDEHRSSTVPRIDHTLRWLLRRYVDPEWIDIRLPESSGLQGLAADESAPHAPEPPAVLRSSQL